jgi:hypothetical protein
MSRPRISALIALACLAFLACQPAGTESTRQWPEDTSPTGRAALLAHWERQGIDVDLRQVGPETSPLWDEATTLVVAPPSTQSLADSSSQDIAKWKLRLQWWHEDGIDIVWVGSLAPWIQSIEATLPQAEPFDVVDGTLEPPLLPVRTVYAMPRDMDTLELTTEDERFTLRPLLRDSEGGVVVAVLAGESWEMLCVSDPVLLTNAALLHSENEAWIGLVAGSAEAMIVVERVYDDPFELRGESESPWRQRLFVAAHLLLFWLVWVWARGVAVIRYPDWVRVPRRARAEHARALGRQLRSMEHHDTALRVFARWALDELRRRSGASRRAGSHDLTELMTELTRRSGLEREEVVRRWQATLWALDDGGADAPERIAELNDLLQRTQNSRTQDKRIQNDSTQGQP